MIVVKLQENSSDKLLLSVICIFYAFSICVYYFSAHYIVFPVQFHKYHYCYIKHVVITFEQFITLKWNI